MSAARTASVTDSSLNLGTILASTTHLEMVVDFETICLVDKLFPNQRLRGRIWSEVYREFLEFSIVTAGFYLASASAIFPLKASLEGAALYRIACCRLA